MQSQSALVLALVCITAVHPLAGDPKLKNLQINWPKVAQWVNENILRKYKGKVTLHAPVYVGKVFGTVGNSEEGLFEETGYKQMLINDHSGKLNGRVYQKTILKLLGIKGVKSDLGANLHWTKDNANVYVKLSKPIAGKNTTVTVDGSGDFKLKDGTEVFIKNLDANIILRSKPKTAKK